MIESKELQKFVEIFDHLKAAESYRGRASVTQGKRTGLGKSICDGRGVLHRSTLTDHNFSRAEWPKVRIVDDLTAATSTTFGSSRPAARLIFCRRICASRA